MKTAIKKTVTKKVVVKPIGAKPITRFRPLILSRHPSHNCLRAKTTNLPTLPVRSVVRLGSTTEVEDTVAKGGNRIEINTIRSIQNSSNKLSMKNKFIEAGVKTAEWVSGRDATPSSLRDWAAGRFPIVAKAHFGSKGKGNTLIKSQSELEEWMRGKTLSNYIYEKFMNYGHEFRLHVTEEGCFYVCRKALKKDTPEEEKWHFHDTTCVWLLETNPEFHRPNSFNDIVSDCVKALKAVGADILSFDVKVQKPTNEKGERRSYQDYILLECNSASSMDNGSGELSVCAQKYIEELPKLIMRKAKQVGK